MSESINTVVFFVAGSSFAFSALFYNLYQKKKEELLKLKARNTCFQARPAVGSSPSSKSSQAPSVCCCRRPGPGRRGAPGQPVRPAVLRRDPEADRRGAVEVLELPHQDVEFPDKKQKREEKRGAVQPGQPRSLRHRRLPEGSKPPGSLRQLPGTGSLPSAACRGGLGGSGGAGHQRRETGLQGGERGAAAGGEHPDGLRRGGDGGRPGDEAAGPRGRPQVCPGLRRPQELSGQAPEVGQHVEEADGRQRPSREPPF
ncbi:unnamed protein product [Tetraodon nigroviridis]|uniref:(spotted green pufferfish) hypothetical protein n=1 Tax=Tetraodon nigroviridis TaxID=99883 RepID=Q4SNU1_TETNG|nr:unnamed protein product [Tetraodon nigroviridis]